ncbi:hypothetical protein BGW37DRAFT_483035 [Umbelopsis sp. PMI_123]|nr:hypothetical protein BGW37DRAFT_483035 [Umbelopsis sp. PMI_123]
MRLEQCCCCIPLRAGTFIIALWFFVTNLFETTSGFLGRNSIFAYASQSSKAIFIIQQIFTLLIAAGGLFGMIGSCVASRKFAKIFSITVWTACALSIIKYLLALILIATHRENVIESCEATGFVSMTHPESSITATFTSSPYYHPVSYPGTLNASSMSYDECSQAVKVMLITFGVVVFIIQIVQIYFASVVSAYSSRLRNGARHHRLHDQQIKDFEESRYQMATVY